MCNLIKNFIPLFLVTLQLCVSAFGNRTIKDLGLICAVRKNYKLTTIPSQCTSVAVYSEELEQLAAVDRMRGDMPLLIIVNSVHFNEIGDVINGAVDKILKNYVNLKFDFMVFDHTYKVVNGDSSSDTKFSQDVGTFLQKSREMFQGKGFGLILGHDVNFVEEKVDLSILNDHSDLFILESTGYRDCNKHIHQRDMEVLATRDDVFQSLAALREARVTMDKVFYTIELQIESRKGYNKELMDYTYLCSHKLSVHRKYCFNSIQNLFEKARLQLTEGTAGIFINGVDSDDFGGTCGCISPNDPDPSFRGLKTIAGASQEDKKDLFFYDCIEGAYPIILN